MKIYLLTGGALLWYISDKKETEFSVADLVC